MLEINQINEKQAEAILLAAKERKNTYIAGAAGTGKSAIIEILEHYFTKLGLNTVVCAPTGMSANAVKGTTIHRFLRAGLGVILPDEDPKEGNDILDAVDVIIIDEIGFVGCDMISFLARSIEESKKRRPREVQLVVLGDVRQLGPVVKNEEKSVLAYYWGKDAIGRYPFVAREWNDFNFEVVNLTEQMRQLDATYLENCEKISMGDFSGAHYFDQFVDPDKCRDRVVLCAKRKMVRKINLERLAELNTEGMYYQTVRDGMQDRKAEITEDTIHLKIGAPVIALNNDSQGRYFNGSMDVIVGLSRSEATVKFNDGQIVSVQRNTWPVFDYRKRNGKIEKVEAGYYSQIPLAVAFAMTIHKAQGLTLGPIGVHPSCFAPGQLYTSLTRVRRPEDLCLTQRIREKDVKVDPVVDRFYREAVLKAG